MNPQPRDSSEVYVCECDDGSSGWFRYRGDPDWWSCVDCEGRTQKLTKAEKADMDSRPGAAAPGQKERGLDAS